MPIDASGPPLASGSPLASGPPLAFDRHEGAIRHRFFRHGPVAAHVALTSGTTPRVIVAFPAGNRGILLAGATHADPVTFEFGGPVAPLDLETDGLRGVVVPLVAEAPELRFARTVLGNLRTIRDAIGGAPLTPRLRRHAVAVTGRAHDRALAVERPGLDGRHVYAIGIEPREGSDVAAEPDGTITLRAGPDGLIRFDLVAACDEAPLTPVPVACLLRPGATLSGESAPRDLESLAFLAYREKLLAGSWQYLTYFGRDTLLALRLLAPVASADLFEAGLGAVLDRLAPEGDVAHEETLGEYAILHRERARRRSRRLSAAPPGHDRDWGRGRAAPLLDDKMVDDDFLLAPVLATYLLDVATPDRAEAFLATDHGRFREAVRANLALVTARARPYATSGHARDLIHLREGVPVGTWRDSTDGLGGGRVPYDVNVALVPAALAAAARLWESAVLGPDPERAAEARSLARAWGETARHFDVTLSNAEARTRLAAFGVARGLPETAAALASLGNGPVTFPAIALYGDLRPVPVVHGDDSLAMLLTDPSPADLDGMAHRLLSPFPAGLRLPGAGTLVANPAYAETPVQGRFTAGHYHGTVIWSWPMAAYAAGLARQCARADLPDATRARLRAAETALWHGIDATAGLRGSEFWTFAIRDGRYAAVPAQGAGIVNESNPVQLWSTVWLGIARPRLDRAAIPGA